MRALMLMLLTLCACAGEPAPRAPAAAKRLAATPEPAQRASEPSAPPAVVPTRMPLGQQLAHEASARPVRALRFAALIEAVGAEGVQIGRRKQVLASTIGAAYCEAARSAHGLGVVLCEFADATDAVNGVLRSKQTFDTLVPGRTLRTHDNTVLTLTQPVDDEATREARVVERAFASLAPS